MRIISRKNLREFWEKYPDSRQPLQAWCADVKHSGWKKPSDIKNVYRNASFLSNNRVVFNIIENNYRVIVVVEYSFGVVYIRFVGTHKEYDRINAETI
jgi:mRNA interferase HigB